jgi:hypothetical protein
MQKELPKPRIARPPDEEPIMAMCRRLHAENGLFSLSEDKVRDCLHRCFTGTGTIVAVIGPTAAIEASMCLAMSNFYYTTDVHLEEQWNFVDKDYRKSRNAEALIEFGKECAEKMGMAFFTGIITNKQMAGKVRLYRRLLGQPAGAYFIHNANWKREPMEEHQELRQRLKELAQKCNDGKITMKMAKSQLAPLLREAVDAIGSDDNLWGSASHTNGSITRGI